MRRSAVALCLLLVMAAGCAGEPEETGMEITSTAFDEGGSIPAKYTCDGRDISPPLSWSGVPPGTESLVLIVDDPDAPGGTFIHWVLYDVPPGTEGLGEGESAGSAGSNDFGDKGYGGPCPPSGTHRYRFQLFALDSELGLETGASRQRVEDAMEGHMIASDRLTGRYGS